MQVAAAAATKAARRQVAVNRRLYKAAAELRGNERNKAPNRLEPNRVKARVRHRPERSGLIGKNAVALISASVQLQPTAGARPYGAGIVR